MADKKFTVLDLLSMELHGHDRIDLRCVAGRKGLTRLITVPDINRPGLALSGFYESFAYQRIQIFGRGEYAYLAKLEHDGHIDALKKFFSFAIPCCIFTHSLEPTPTFKELAENAGCAILIADLETTELSNRLVRLFYTIFAPRKTMHGVLVEVFGEGILISGHSGVGKSETALDLIERGHRLVADDIVEIRCVSGNRIIGQGANSLISHHMEIRGLGIINVTELYGVGAIREQKEIQLIVELEEWDVNKVYDRIGTSGRTKDLLGVKIPAIEIPVKPGRNLPIIIEAAAMNERLKKMGYNSARDFNQNVLRWIETGEAQAAYYNQEDIY